MADPLLATLEDAVRRDPDDADARMIYGDALLERADPRGELIALARDIQDQHGDDDGSAELARRARTLERTLRERVSAELPKRAFALCQFRNGMVDGVEPVGALSHDTIVRVLKQPELVALRRLDLRRCWPESHSSRRLLLDNLLELVAGGRATPPPLVWLGLGPGTTAEDVARLQAGLPRLNGFGLSVAEALPIFESAPRGIVDLELASGDMSSRLVSALADMALERLVIAAPARGDLERFLSASSTVRLRSLGFLCSNDEETLAFVRRIVDTPLFAQLASFGIACNDLADDTRDWIVDHEESFAHVTWFTLPSDLLEDEPDWDDARANLAHLLYEMDREDEVLSLCDDLVVADPASAWCWDMLGDVLRKRDRYEEALEAHTHACELDRHDCGAWAGRADALHELTRYDDALHAWGRAVTIDDSEPFAFEGRGRTLWQLGRHDEALAAFAAAVKADKNYPSARVNRADLLRALGRLDEAFRSYERCTKLDVAEIGDVVDGLCGMGLVCQLRGDRKAARGHFRDAAKRAKGTAAAVRPLTDLAFDDVLAGELPRALTLLDRACDEGQGASEYAREQRAWLLVDLGRADEALAAFRELGYDGDDAEHVLALDALGRASEALELLAAGAREPMHGCLTKWVLGHVIRAALSNGAPWRFPAPADPRALHAALAEQARAAGGVVDCHPVRCAHDTALVALLAAVLRGDATDTGARALALAADVEVHGIRGALSRAWEVRWLARRAGASDRVLEAALRAVEGFAPPRAIRDQLDARR